MMSRVAASRCPSIVPDRVDSMVDWHGAVSRPIHFVFQPLRHRFAQRRSLREERIAALEESWLRLSAMSDAQVVGLEPRAAGSPARAADVADPRKL